MARRRVTGLPTAEVIALLLVVGGAVLYALAHSASSFDMVSLDTIAAAGEPSAVPAEALLAFRVGAALLIGGTCAVDWLPSSGQYHTNALWQGSKLAPDRYYFQGPQKLAFFTGICWFLQLVYFCMAIVCTGLASGLLGPPPAAPVAHALACAVWLVYEVSFACALLITTVVTFVLIPDMARRPQTHDVEALMFMPVLLLMHNANVVLMATELLFNSIPLTLAHFPASALLGLGYAVLTWVVCARTGMVPYPFLDPTLPPRTSIPALLLLLGALAAFYCLGVLAAAAAHLAPLPARVVGVYTFCVSIMTTRTIRGVPPPRA